MSELLSVGLDVGTTTTQLVVSRLTAQNRASGFAVPRMEITGRELLYQSPIHFTPLIRDELIDGDGIRAIVEQEYRRAGITPEAVDTGAVIITGETSRKENAESVLHALSRFAGNFVVATAGPDLESVLAAKGAGAVEASEKGPVLHFDIGGGTSNLALCIDGKVVATGCLNVGGRLLKFDKQGNPTYVSPVLKNLPSSVILSEHSESKDPLSKGTDSSPTLGMTEKAIKIPCHPERVAERSESSNVMIAGGNHTATKAQRVEESAPSCHPERVAERSESSNVMIAGGNHTATKAQRVEESAPSCHPERAQRVEGSASQTAHYLATILEMAAGLREKTPDYCHFITPGTADLIPPTGVTLSFSGGVADCIEKDIDPLAYGDLGPLLGKAIRESRLCQVPYRLGSHTIRATVIGAGCHSAQLSGSTIFTQNTALPIQNLPVCTLTRTEQDDPALKELIRRKLSALDSPGALFLPGWVSPPYRRVTDLADIVAEFRCPVVLEADMAKALGAALALRLPKDAPILCIDGLSIPEGSYLDIGAPVGPSLTVIIKTLIFEK